MVVQVPGDGMRPVIEAFAGEFRAQFDDQIDRGLRQPGWLGVWTSGPRLERGLTLAAIAGHQPADPALGDPVLAGHSRLATALDDDSGNDQASLRHQPTVGRSPHSDVLRHAIRMS
jgi:hypothetical protein